MKLNPQFCLWLKCVGIFVVIGAIAWGIWDNPMFAATPQEPGPFLDYQPEILGAFVFLYFFPTIFLFVIDSSYNPVFALGSGGATLSMLGLFAAIVVLPLFYGSIVYGILRLATAAKNYLRK